MIKVGVIGGSGYTGGELLRLLSAHSQVELSFVYSRTRAGKPVSSAHPDLLGLTDLRFSGEVQPDVDLVFLCLGHGNSRKFLEEQIFSPETKIIDLSSDFRLKEDCSFNGQPFVYGLPELYKEQIQQASYIANPGCFATAIQLALLPMARMGILTGDVHVNATTGSTGAGVVPSETTHFSWRNNNVSWYKAFTHQHLDEIEESLDNEQTNRGDLLFLPVRGNFSRGIFATAYTRYNGDQDTVVNLFKDYYREAAFTQISEHPVHLKQVVNTNQCHLHVHLGEGVLLVTSVIDNLLKGASGQAVQNMNLMFGFPETKGLNLKASAF
ncbi:N-acetyl-gamma-glutamyl-phosphate reductase [Lentiprolixibacter aurantiacus]|uniref:N-acetyl-gamma-glutamyl-phosphate reductase n=1 Tax=Lentiprolixibacter aurantiacus TaxID=2993939 RepID=A0AAE3MJ26_9FLAO|nr:N-acetyl-gamma-glutamyl-phosphate reductase [Lentiprolixibacter aurantiacus]MCX2718148.1 N-acetyl-gamma-glutamyl-phosphate reductase [Lentiprolixibacter aurantiacus]